MAEDGTRVKAADHPDVYVVLDGKRRYISEPIYLTMFTGWEGISEIDLNELEDGGSIRDGYVARDEDDGTYLVTDDVKYPINGEAGGARLMLRIGDARQLSNDQAVALATGPRLG